jgi:putative transposase
MPFQPCNPNAETHIHRQRLPHWRQWGTTYFVTTRLADSIPTRLAKEWHLKRDDWLRVHGLTESDYTNKLTDDQHKIYHREFTAKFHDLMDAGHGDCLLARKACADLLINRLVVVHSKAYHLDAWCIMPNHLHALIEPAKEVTLGEILRHWKGGSAHDINQLLNRRGSLWQREPFDHIVRSEMQLEHFRRYISENPAKARLDTGFIVGFGPELRQSSHAL